MGAEIFYISLHSETGVFRHPTEQTRENTVRIRDSTRCCKSRNECFRTCHWTRVREGRKAWDKSENLPVS